MVKFNDPDEFLEELDSDMGKVERNIIRLTHLLRPSKLSPNINHLQVIATVKVMGEVLRLECYCGDTWGMEGQDKTVLDKADAILKKIKEYCAGRLDVRSGVFE